MNPTYLVYLDGIKIRTAAQYTEGLAAYTRAKNENPDKEVVFVRETPLSKRKANSDQELTEQSAA